MIQFIKKNKILSFLLIITIINIIGSMIILSILDDNIKKEITTKALKILQNKELQKNIIEKQPILKTINQNTFFIILFWILGISIIGIPIILFFYLIKTTLLTWNILLIVKYCNLNNLLFTLLYLLPNIITTLLLFIITFFAISYSILLIKILFIKKNFPIQQITKNYIKILFVNLTIALFQSIIQVFLFPKII